MMSSQKQTEIKLSQFYNSAVNAVTKPNKITWCSNYFIDRWMPVLGNEGTRIVLALRRRGFNDRHGGKREEIKICRAELAELVGCSEDTLTREIGGINKKTGQPYNPCLSYFVQKWENKKRSPKTGRILQEENGYWVSMDDPIHPDDWPLVEEYVREREALTEKGAASKTHIAPETHFASSVGEPETHSASSGTQNAPPETQNAFETPQNASRLNKEDSDSLIPLNTLNTAALPQSSTSSLFPDSEPEETGLPIWVNLTPDQQEPFRAQAKHELLPYALQAGEKAWARMGPRQEEVRARNLYEASLKNITLTASPPSNGKS